MTQESSSTSTKRGIAPRLRIAVMVGIAVCETVITSSPDVTPEAMRERTSASVPELQPTNFALDEGGGADEVVARVRAISSSKMRSSSPSTYHPPANVFWTALNMEWL